MHVKKYLHTLLDNAIHKSRVKSLIPVIDALITTKVMRLTQLGRNLNTPGKERAGIRRIDRLLGNTFYQKQSPTIYKTLASVAVGAKTRPIILVDWSGLPNSLRKTTDGEQVVLRATLAAEGRGLTIYDEVHPKKKENNPKVHKNFLKKLKLLLPEGCRPIIVTDAGFKIPWFRNVLSHGWDYVGRVRGKFTYEDGNEFKPISSLHQLATYTAKFMGEIILAKTQKFKTNLYLYKHKLIGRKKLNKNGTVAKDEHSRKHSGAYREPWVLVSSLNSSFSAKKVVKIYKWRMSIEENFRDMKSEVYGFSMNENQTIKSERYIVWLMLSALASFIAWIVGYSAEKMGLHYDFQANTYRHRRVLSFFYLGCQVIKKRINVPINFKQIQIEAWSQQL